MRLNDFHKSIGLGSIVSNTRKLNKILRLASFSPDFCFEKAADKKGRIYFDRYKYLGAGFGVSVHGFRRWRVNKEGKNVEKHVVMDWGIFANGHEDTNVSHAFVDTDASRLAYCFAEEVPTGNNFEFKISNSLEILEKYRSLKNHDAVVDFEASINKVNMAMLMIYGTILLPVVKNEEYQDFRMEEEALQKELMARARQGDSEAQQSLHKMAAEQETDLRERLSNEDLLSVFEGYFLNLAEKSGIFSVLADILTVEELTNEASLERVFRLGVSVTDTKVTMYVSDKDLTGMPMVGMRIMGIGMLQGKILESR